MKDESPLDQCRINFNMFYKAPNPRNKKLSLHTINNDCIKLAHEKNAKLKNKMKDQRMFTLQVIRGHLGKQFFHDSHDALCGC